MGVILNERGEILRSYIDKNRDSDADSRLFQTQLLEKNDSQTIQQYQLSGFQSRPPTGSEIIVSDLGGGAFKISIAEDDKILNQQLNEGESFIYSSSGGVVAASIHLKNDGSIDISAPAGLNITGPVDASATIDAVGNISTEADMSADGDVFADALATVISLINHFHLGNLGYNTGPSLPAGGGVAPPASPPSAAGGTLDMNGNDITNVSGISDTVGTHKHAQGNDSNGDSEVDTDAPN